MSDSIKRFISPNFTYEKLEAPSYEDKIDVFEDRMRGWFFQPAEHLLNLLKYDIAAVFLLFNYFEGIEMYITGKDSRNKSKEYFSRGFLRVFKLTHLEPTFISNITDFIYDEVRCGFAHDGMFRNRIFFSRERSEPFIVTCPIKNGVFDYSGQVESIVINPIRFFGEIKIHFDGYVKELRNGTDPVKKAFENIVAIKWGLGEPDRVIGMNEDEFLKT